jgi:hypothetical protein
MEVLRRLSVFRERLGPEVGTAFDALAERLRLFFGHSGEGYFSHPLALPVLELPRWAAAGHGTMVAPSTLTNLAEAAMAGYLHVRVQDDWFDEQVGEPGAVMMLADALFARHQILLAREVDAGSAFWELFEEVWLGYREAMLFERGLHTSGEPYDAVAFGKVLARSRPLMLPPAAALFVADRPEDVRLLERFASALNAGHQLFADLLDVEKDRANGHMTYVLFRLGARMGDACGADALRVALFSRGGFDAVVSDALDELARAQQAAEALAMPEAVHFLEERAQIMAGIQRKVFEALFSRLQGRGADRPEEHPS